MKCHFNPAFADHLFFIYLGRKQDSQESVRKFKAQPLRDDKIISQVSDLTDAFINIIWILRIFYRLCALHEDAISAAIGLPAVKQEFFPDFKGEIKSLGAWGGDFVMAATTMSRKEVRDYFQRKNLKVIFSGRKLYIEIKPTPG